MTLARVTRFPHAAPTGACSPRRTPLQVLVLAEAPEHAAPWLAALAEAGHALHHESAAAPGALQAALRQREWSLVLLLAGVPGLAPAEVAGLVRRHDPELPFIVVAEAAGPGQAAQAMGQGAADFVSRDDPERFVPAVEREVRGAHYRRRRRATERALADSDAKFRDLVESSLQGVLVRRGHKPLFANRAFAAMHGYDDPADILALDDCIATLVAPEDRELLRAYVRDRAAGRPGPAQHEVRGLRKDGRRVWMQVVASEVAWDGEPATLITLVDITVRKAAQLALERQQALLRTVIDTIPHRVIVKDRDYRYVLVNAAFSEAAGEPAEAFHGRHTRDVRGARLASREQALAGDRAVLEEGRTRVDLLETTGGGEHAEGYIRTVKAPLRDADGRVWGLVGISEDITDQRRAEMEVAQAHAKLMDAIDSSPAGFCYLDAEGRVQLWNAKLLDLFPMLVPLVEPGVRVETLVRAVASSLLGPDGDVEGWIAERMARMGAPGGHPYEMHLPDGVTVLVQDRASSAGGTVIVVVDITERKQAMEALAASEANYRSLMEQATDAIFTADETGRFLQVNPAAAELSGYDEAELLGMCFQQLTAPESLAQDPLNEADLAAGRLVCSERPLRRKDGRTVIVETRARLRPDGLVQGIVRDVTARVEADRALQASQSLLQAVFETIPQFLFVKDREGRYLMVNDRFAHAWNVQPADLVSRHVLDLEHRPLAERQRNHEHDQLILSGNVPRLEGIGDVVFADGTTHIVRTIKSALRDEAGEVYGLVGITEDVTELERAQRELREKERLLQSVFDTMPHLVAVKDAQGRYLVVNRRLSEALAMPSESLLGRFPADVPTFSPDQERWRAQEIDRQILAGEIERSDVVAQVRFADGVPRSVRQIKEPLRDDHGRIYGLVAVIEDVTALDQAQAEAHAAHARLADAVRHLWGAFYLYDRDERLLVWNDNVYDLFPALRGRLREGVSFEEVLRLAMPDVDQPDEDIEAHVARRLAEFRDPPEHIMEQRLMDGRWLLVRDRKTAEGGTVCVRLDVTEHKRAEQALRDSEQRFRLLTENAPDVIFRYQLWPHRAFDYVSPVAAAITGYTTEEHYADPDLWLRITHPDDLAQQQHLFDLDEDSVGALISVRWKYKGAGWIWIEERCLPVCDESGRLVAIEGIARDISARKDLEGQLLQAQRMEAVGRLAGGIAHDFNNMLSVMGSYSTFVLEALPDAHPAREDVQVIQNAVERSATLTRQLLAFSRKQTLRMRPVGLNELVGNMEKILRRLIGEDIDLSTQLAEDLGPVSADPGQIEQIVMNLVVNARDAMPQGGTLTLVTGNLAVDGERAARHADLKPGPHVMLAVTDTGVGMSEEVRTHIFEPFFTTKDVGQGTGLGLSTVYGIVKQMNGEVWVHSEPGAGTTFRIVLPRLAAGSPGAHTPDRAAPAAGGSETVLLVEDEDLVRFAARRILEQSGYTVLPAANARAAELIFEQSGDRVDLVLTDVVMPEMSGPQLVERLVARQPQLKVLYMTGYTESTIVSHLGTDVLPEIVFKPFSPEKLLSTVRLVLGRTAG